MLLSKHRGKQTNIKLLYKKEYFVPATHLERGYATIQSGRLLQHDLPLIVDGEVLLRTSV